MIRIDKDTEWWLEMAKKEGDYPVGVPYSGTPCLCGARREEDCSPSDCERSMSELFQRIECQCCGCRIAPHEWYAAAHAADLPLEAYCSETCWRSHMDHDCACFSEDDELEVGE